MAHGLVEYSVNVQSWADVVFLGVVAWLLLCFVWANVRAERARDGSTPWLRWTGFGLLWLVATGTPTLAGWIAPRGPLPPQVVLLMVLAGALGFGLSTRGRVVARAVPLWTLIGFQAFRLPLEVVLEAWGEQGIAPVQLTWSGQNFDVITGVLALLSVPFLRARPRLAWITTVVGILLLLNIARIVVTSLPGPLQRFEEPLVMPTLFPQVWIATVCVTAAVVGHVLAVRVLLRPDAAHGAAPEGEAAHDL